MLSTLAMPRCLNATEAGRNQFMVFTENLLENTDGGRSTLPVFSRGGTLLPSIYADMRALLMTSSHSEGYVLPDYNDDVEIEVLCQSGDGSTPAEAGALAIANPECKPVDCGVPPDVPRRELSTYAAGQTSFGTVVEFDCATGWIGSGGRMVCDFDGAWMVTRERCTATTTTTTQCKSPASPPASPPFSPLVLSFALSKLPV